MSNISIEKIDPSNVKPTTQTVIKKLMSFGLSPIESRIYLSLVQGTDKTIVELSKDTKIPRTTLYEHIELLIKKGLVERIIKYKSQSFKAYPIDILQNLVEEEKARIETLDSTLEELKHDLPLFALASELPQTQVRYYHGSSGIRQMMWNALSAEKENIGYSVMGRKSVVGEKFLKRFLEEFGLRNLTDRVLINPIGETIQYITDGNLSIHNKLANFEHIRSIDKKILTIAGDTTIYNNVFAVMYWKKGEVVGVEIENPELVAMQKSIFEILWKIAKPLEQQ